MEDKVIVDSILRSGRTQLFSLIVKKYGSTVYAKALAIIKDAEEAKEIAQQTFVKAYQQLEDWQGTQLGPWLVAIACHLSLNALEKAKRKHSVDAEQVQIPDEAYSEEREERLQRMEKGDSETEKITSNAALKPKLRKLKLQGIVSKFGPVLGEKAKKALAEQAE